MSYFTLPFVQRSPPYDETQIPFDNNPGDYVCRLSQGKSFSLPSKDDDIVITADSVVIFENRVYGKPKDQEEAFHMLSTLCGKWQEVYTGVSVRKNQTIHSDFEITKVLLNNFNPAQIRAYQTRCHSIDKAAGYAIQRDGGVIVKDIQGCFYNVMGLPINTLRNLLLKVGIDLWDYIGFPI